MGGATRIARWRLHGVTRGPVTVRGPILRLWRGAATSLSQISPYASIVPSSVAGLLASAGLKASGCVRWRSPVPEMATGVYLVSLSASAEGVGGARSDAPIDPAALGELIRACPDLTLDDRHGPAAEQLSHRLASYWLPDECVLYIGLAGQALRTRVRQYYATPLGASRPHAGGWWLKTLALLDELYVHYAVTTDYKAAEETMLRVFAANLSGRARAALPVGAPAMPFANLRDGDWRRRSHGIGNATSGPRRAARTHPGVGLPDPESASADHVRSASTATQSTASKPPSAHRTQNVTEADIRAGRVRIPRGVAKTPLPSRPCTVALTIHGRQLECRWDPRYGPPERSGVISVGKAAAASLLAPGDVLALSVTPDGVIELK